MCSDSPSPNASFAQIRSVYSRKVRKLGTAVVQLTEGTCRDGFYKTGWHGDRSLVPPWIRF